MGLEYTRGWGEYFDYEAVNIFIFAAVLMLGSVAFAQDKNLGLLPIVRVSRHGRAKTAVAKLAALTVATSFVTLASVSYTHLDVYKRQIQGCTRILLLSGLCGIWLLSKA